MSENDKIPTPWELFRIECGSGWKDLYEPLIEYIQRYNEDKPIEEQIQITQIKEKFGGLRFYVSHATDELRDMINKAEHESYSTCEICGSKENIGFKMGWIQTICHDCIKEMAVKEGDVFRWKKKGTNDTYWIFKDKDDELIKNE